MLKKIMLGTLSCLLLTATTVQAQEVQLSNGKRTIIIDVDNDDRDQERRIRRLERAVRDLQDQVWQLHAQGGIRGDLFVCQVKAFANVYKSDKHQLQYDAQEQAIERCQERYHSMHCDKVTCQKIN